VEITEARAAAVRAGVVAKPSEGWERECEGDSALSSNLRSNSNSNSGAKPSWASVALISGEEMITEARAAAVRAGVVAKPSEGWERECEGDWAVGPDGGNPAFSRAIPHAMVGITPLLRVLLFGSFLGSRKGARMDSQMDPKWDRKRTTKRVFEIRTRKLEPGNSNPELELETRTGMSNLRSNSNSNSNSCAQPSWAFVALISGYWDQPRTTIESVGSPVLFCTVRDAGEEWQPVLGGYFSIFVLARPPGAMVPESSIVLHFRPALDPLPVSDNLELVF